MENLRFTYLNRWLEAPGFSRWIESAGIESARKARETRSPVVVLIFHCYRQFEGDDFTWGCITAIPLFALSDLLYYFFLILSI